MILLSLLALILIIQASAPGPSVPPSPTGTSAEPSEVPTPTDAKERLELAEKVNGLAGLEVPWHLKASYQSFRPDGKPADTGTFEEWRVNAKQYRIALHSSSASADEYGTDNGIFRTGQTELLRRPLSSIKALVEKPASPIKDPEKTVLKNYERNFGSGKKPCTALLGSGPDHSPENAESYCFASTNAVLFYSSTPTKTAETLFQQIAMASGHYFARDIQVFIVGQPWLKLHVDTVEGIGPAGMDALKVPSDASPVPVRVGIPGEVVTGRLIKKAFPVYPAEAKLKGVQGRVVLDALIGTDGHLKDLQVLAGPTMLQQPALDAVRQWVYTPYLLNGKPVEVETEVNVLFSLGR